MTLGTSAEGNQVLDHLNVSNTIKLFGSDYDLQFIVIKCDWVQPDSFVVGVNYTEFLALEDGTDRLSWNVGGELQPYDAWYPRRAQSSCTEQVSSAAASLWNST
jgi:hypothetical protein